MATQADNLVHEIQELQTGILGDEAEIILKMVKIGEKLVQLKCLSNGDWARRLESTGYDQRTANRYMYLGRSWWAKDGLKNSGLLHELPLDLLKLEWLCRLSKKQLSDGLSNWEVREDERSVVIRHVKKKIGFKTRRKSVRVISIDLISEEVDRFVERTLEVIQVSSDELADPEIRQRLLEEVMNKLAKVQEALSSETADEAPPIEEGGANSTAGENVQERPATGTAA